MDISAYSHIIWDFNGTILDDLDLGWRSINPLLRRRALPQLSGIEEYHRVFCFPMTTYYKRLGFDFSRESFDDVAAEYTAEYIMLYPEARVFPDVAEKIAEINRAGIPQAVISACEQTLLLRCLDDHGLGGYFSDILGLPDMLASSKAGIAGEWAKRTAPRAALMIGDTLHDAEVAQSIGAGSALITRGHQPRSALLRCGATLLDSAEELIL